MRRGFNTTVSGAAFLPATVIQVWKKGFVIPGVTPHVFRRDNYGYLMRYEDYGNINSEYGWEIDHICPVARGGTDALGNLQPLYWENNRKKSDQLN